MEKEAAQESMSQRIFDSRCADMRVLRIQQAKDPQKAQDDKFRTDLFRKRELLIKAYSGLLHEKNTNQTPANGIDPTYKTLREWSDKVLGDFSPVHLHGIVEKEKPDVAVLKTNVPYEIRDCFDNAVLNIHIKKAHIDKKLAEMVVPEKQFIQNANSDLDRLKSELTQHFESIQANDKGNWRNMQDLNHDFVHSLEILHKAKTELHKAETVFDPHIV